MSALFDTLVFMAFLTPSLSFAMLIYWPVFGGFSVYCRIKFETLNGEPLATFEFMTRMVTVMVFSTAIFYLLQKRELKRFLHQQDLIIKEQIASRKE